MHGNVDVDVGRTMGSGVSVQNPAKGILADRQVLRDGLKEVAPGHVRYEVSYCHYGATMVSCVFLDGLMVTRGCPISFWASLLKCRLVVTSSAHVLPSSTCL